VRASVARRKTQDELNAADGQAATLPQQPKRDGHQNQRSEENLPFKPFENERCGSGDWCRERRGSVAGLPRVCLGRSVVYEKVKKHSDSDGYVTSYTPMSRCDFNWSRDTSFSEKKEY